jgi:hypothetical protein
MKAMVLDGLALGTTVMLFSCTRGERERFERERERWRYELVQLEESGWVASGFEEQRGGKEGGEC